MHVHPMGWSLMVLNEIVDLVSRARLLLEAAVKEGGGYCLVHWAPNPMPMEPRATPGPLGSSHAYSPVAVLAVK